MLYGLYGYPFGFGFPGFGYPSTIGGATAAAIPATTVATSPFPI